MDDEIGREILEEIRRTRRFNERLGIIVLWALIAVCGLFAWRVLNLGALGSSQAKPVLSANTEPSAPSSTGTYASAVYDSLERGEIKKANEYAAAWIKVSPLDDSAHAALGRVYLIMGKLPEALEKYQRAFELYPSETNEKLLQTIQRRIEMDGKSAPSSR